MMNTEPAPNQMLDETYNPGDEMLEMEYEDRSGCGHEEDPPYDGGGWAGDGSGVDDLADFNANEADDYRDEEWSGDSDGTVGCD